jgi:HTH-type transcriptional regulator / antitoxin HigA
MKIQTEQDYQALMAHIEEFLQKATEGGGFDALSKAEVSELHQLSLLAEAYEDSIPIMPLPASSPKTLVDS